MDHPLDIARTNSAPTVSDLARSALVRAVVAYLTATKESIEDMCTPEEWNRAATGTLLQDRQCFRSFVSLVLSATKGARREHQQFAQALCTALVERVWIDETNRRVVWFNVASFPAPRPTDDEMERAFQQIAAHFDQLD